MFLAKDLFSLLATLIMASRWSEDPLAFRETVMLKERFSLLSVMRYKNRSVLARTSELNVLLENNLSYRYIKQILHFGLSDVKHKL